MQVPEVCSGFTESIQFIQLHAVCSGFLQDISFMQFAQFSSVTSSSSLTISRQFQFSSLVSSVSPGPDIPAYLIHSMFSISGQSNTTGTQ